MSDFALIQKEINLANRAFEKFQGLLPGFNSAAQRGDFEGAEMVRLEIISALESYFDNLLSAFQRNHS